MTALVLKVEGVAGSSVKEIAAEMIWLAMSLNVLVECNVNGFQMMAGPASTPQEIEAEYSSWMAANP